MEVIYENLPRNIQGIKEKDMTTTPLPEKWIRNFDDFYNEDGFSISAEELKDFIRKLLLQSYEQGKREEREKIKKYTDDLVPCDNKKHNMALLRILNALQEEKI